MTAINTGLQITRRPEKFASDDKRVITRYLDFGNPARIRSILGRLLLLDDATVAAELEQVRRDFKSRHRDLDASMRRNFDMVAPHLDCADMLSEERRLLIGAYFTLEYSIESAALFNPSIVPHPDQRDVPAGAVRFLMSLRATGEGHISSIVFRRGIVHGDGTIAFDPPPRYAFTARPEPDGMYEKNLFRRKLMEMGDWKEMADAVLQPLPRWFSREQLDAAIACYNCPPDRRAVFNGIAADMRWLTEANYTLKFPLDAYPSEMVIFPATEVERQGMEDLRLVQFTDDDGVRMYYGTYTAYDGKRILPMLMETTDFHTFHISTLNGRWVTNKGIAIFPRKVGGRYMNIARHDGEKLYLLTSDDPHFWDESVLLQSPAQPWELVQIGNCGSPIETERGWVLLTHGVGPMRRYCIGAMLLDLEDPSRVIGRLRQPLLVPDDDEREGYVPNVVYSCGAMCHGDTLVIPYAMSDVATKFATVRGDQLVDQLLDDGP
jgi:predicted GH43/DUF377 family glycosyl hydrolase